MLLRSNAGSRTMHLGLPKTIKMEALSVASMGFREGRPHLLYDACQFSIIVPSCTQLKNLSLDPSILVKSH